MTDSPGTGPKPTVKRRRYYVHSFQKKYAIIFGLPLITYSVLLFGLILLGPYIMLTVELAQALYMTQAVQSQDLLIEQRYLARQQFLALSETVWPALLALIVSSAFLSFLLTHRIAGPLHRLHLSFKEIAQGNLALRIRFRKKDELHELAEVTNEALATIEEAMLEIRDREAVERQAVRRLAEAMRTQPASLPAVKDDVDVALKEGEQIEAVFQRFRFSR